VTTLNINAKNCRATEKNYILCRPFSKLHIPLKSLLQEELKSTLFARLKQAHASGVSLGGTIAMKEAVHVTTSRAENFMGSN
jgi:hypothetical protein